MYWLIDKLDNLHMEGFSGLEWCGVLALVLLCFVGAMLLLRRMLRVALFRRSARNSDLSPSVSQANELPGGKEKLLIADDDAAVLQSYLRILGQLGYQTVGAASGAKAIEYMTGNGADLILLDVGMDGIETFRAIRELRPMQKAIALSGYADPARVAALRRMGIEHYLIKPVPLRLLARTIRDVLDRP